MAAFHRMVYVLRRPSLRRSAMGNMPSLPNTLVIGALKSGTTSLHTYLDSHPEIQMSEPKELHFFSEGPDSTWHRGRDWYESHFSSSAPIRGESSTSYTFYPVVRGVPRRMHGMIPEARLIYCVRDPFDRLVSHYLHLRGEGRERRSLEEVLSDPALDSSRYIIRARYWSQIQQYLEWFSEDQLLVVSFEDLRERRVETLARVFTYLGVDETFRSPEWDRVHNAAKRYPVSQAMGRVMSEEQLMSVRRNIRGSSRVLFARPQPVSRPTINAALRERVAEMTQPEVDALRAFTHQRFEQWCV